MLQQTPTPNPGTPMFDLMVQLSWIRDRLENLVGEDHFFIDEDVLREVAEDAGYTVFIANKVVAETGNLEDTPVHPLLQQLVYLRDKLIEAVGDGLAYLDRHDVQEILNDYNTATALALEVVAWQQRGSR